MLFEKYKDVKEEWPDIELEWKGFDKMSLENRKQFIQKNTPGNFTDVTARDENEQVAQNMIENCIGYIPVPLGLGLHFMINQKHILIPMATEEPSVIAAASCAAKTISQNGGFITNHASRNLLTGQILMNDVFDFAEFEYALKNNMDQVIRQGNQFCEALVKRGGGIQSIECSRIELPINSVVVNVLVDVCDLMGGNSVNSIVEGLSSFLSRLTKSTCFCRIVSNHAPFRISTASFSIPVDNLAYKGYSGKFVAEGFVKMYQWALSDLSRAATHNKGIMNGIDAVAVALGQDWRAIEAATYAFACQKYGKLGPFTCYSIDDSNLIGIIEIPILVGSQGGAIKKNPIFRKLLALMGDPNSSELSSIIAAVGLAQNFAAIRAIVTEGIQKGHMALHEKCQENGLSTSIEQVTKDISTLSNQKKENVNIRSSLIIECVALDELISFSVDFDKLGGGTIKIRLNSDSNEEAFWELFAIENILKMMNSIEIHKCNIIQKKLKILVLLITNLLDKMLLLEEEITIRFVELIFEYLKSISIFEIQAKNLLIEDIQNEEIKIGLPLILALWQNFVETIEKECKTDVAPAIIRELEKNIFSITEAASLGDDSIDEFWQFMNLSSKKVPITLILLCEVICVDDFHNKLEDICILGPYFEWEMLVVKELDYYFTKWQQIEQKDIQNFIKDTENFINASFFDSFKSSPLFEKLQFILNDFRKSYKVQDFYGLKLPSSKRKYNE